MDNDAANFFPETAARGPSTYERMQNAEKETNKSLAEQLKDNKERAEAEWAEQFKLRGPKVLDEDEFDFLEARQMAERRKELDAEVAEKIALADFYALKASVSVADEIIVPVVPKPDVPDVLKQQTKPKPLLQVQVRVVPKQKPSPSAATPSAATITSKDSNEDKKRKAAEVSQKPSASQHTSSSSSSSDSKRQHAASSTSATSSSSNASALGLLDYPDSD